MSTDADFRRTVHNSSRTAAAKICFEDQVRVVEITDDQIEFGEIFREISRQLGILREEPGQSSRLNRANALRVKAIFGQGRDVLVTENFDVRAWIRVAQSFDCRKSENEIADRAAANHEDAIHRPINIA